MSQQPELVTENKLWVLVSVLKDGATDYDLERITPDVKTLVDKTCSKGKFLWSGPLDDNKTGLAIFEATGEEAHELFEENKRITSDVLDSYFYHWGAFPFLSVF